MQLTLGCDPELVARHNGVFVLVYNYSKFTGSFGT